MDKRTTEQISYNMRQVKAKGSKIETMLQKELWQRGIRYRKNVKAIIGKPDIAFLGKKVAVFCDSEFWHGYDWETRKNDFRSHQEFWIPKIERNMQRDSEVNSKLQESGWQVIRFWGNDIKNDVQHCADIVEQALNGQKCEGENNEHQ